MQSTARKQPQVVIVGAGFGGLEAAKKLACKDVHLAVIDRTNYHLFQPLLYQVATAALSPADIAAPVRAILSKCENVEVILAEVESVDVEARKVKTNDRVFDYDYLILATGARHSYFGHDEWEKLAPGLKSLEDAVELRRRILLAFEYAEKIEDKAARKAAMTFVVIGGGPTGVEMAGAIAEISRYTLAKDFRHVDPSQARVILIEGARCLLAAYPPDLSESARKQLLELGVEVRTNARATNITEEGVQVDGEFIPCRVKIWAAGNIASFVGKTLSVPVDRVGRAKRQLAAWHVDDDLERAMGPADGHDGGGTSRLAPVLLGAAIVLLAKRDRRRDAGPMKHDWREIGKSFTHAGFFSLRGGACQVDAAARIAGEGPGSGADD